MTNTDVAKELLAIISAAYGGFRYGIKVRLPHAFIMTLLFRSGQSPWSNVKTIFTLTKEHALNLARFAATYKTMLAVLKMCEKLKFWTMVAGEKRIGRWIRKVLEETCGMGGNRLQERKPGYPYRNYHSLIAGAIGGYYVWGSRNKINLQVNLYLFSRVVVALMKRYGWNLEGNETHYAWFSAAIWGAVMFMFEDQPTELQPSLRLSMEEIYRYQL